MRLTKLEKVVVGFSLLALLAGWFFHGHPQKQTAEASAPAEATTGLVMVADPAPKETNFVAVASAAATNVVTPVVAATNNTLVLEFHDFKLGYGQKPRTNK